MPRGRGGKIERRVAARMLRFVGFFAILSLHFTRCATRRFATLFQSRGRSQLNGRSAWCVLLVLAPLATAFPQAARSTGYDVEKSQSVQSAPAGSVGRKTTDREHRVSNAEDTLGNEYNYVLTFGGFARRCPTSAGLVRGDFEYTIAYDATETGDDGVIRREHHVRRLVAQLEGHVGDDARLTHVELTGNFTIERSGTAVAPTSENRPVQTRFTPGPAGEPDMPAMTAAVEMTADIAVASVVLSAGMLYRTAELQWLKLNECVELSFDPPTDTVELGPNQSRQVRVELKAKEDGGSVPLKTDRISAIRSIGTVAPRNVQSADGAPVTLTYTASARPRAGHGIDIATESRAGLAGDRPWRIVDRYEGTFTQVDKTVGSMGIYSGTMTQTMTGRLVWTSEPAGRHPPSYGDVHSAFYRANQGEITVELANINTNAIAGSCETQGRETFALTSLPPSVQYLLLEIAEDGRYKLILAIPDNPPTTWEADSSCRIPGAGTTRQKIPAMLPAIVIGIQEGRLDADQAVVGEMTPVQRGPLTTTGHWSFSLPR
jgi:hypothetical protein